jgi:selenide,water dikinase
VTGFGLLGHLHEMAAASACAAELALEAVPLFDRAYEWADAGVTPGRTTDLVSWATGFSQWHSAQPRDVWMRMLCDPQTSGGLLIAVDPRDADALAQGLAARGVTAARIGRFTQGGPGTISVR